MKQPDYYSMILSSNISWWGKGIKPIILQFMKDVANNADPDFDSKLYVLFYLKHFELYDKTIFDDAIWFDSVYKITRKLIPSQQDGLLIDEYKKFLKMFKFTIDWRKE